jgi:hypothetical protein
MRSNRLSVPRLVLAAASLLTGWLLLSSASGVFPIDVLPSARTMAADRAVVAKFTRTDGSAPVVWQTCAPIEVLVNAGPGGVRAFAEIRNAFDEMSQLTGLQFTLTRADDLVPRSNWVASDQARSLGSPPPVLVGWVDPSETDLLRSGVAGATVANPLRSGSQRSIVSGAIALDANQYGSFKNRDGDGKTRRNLLLHEIGHLLGLDHVDDRSALMHPVVGERSPDGFALGEASALRRNTPAC